MAKKVIGFIKLQIQAGQANPAPPVAIGGLIVIVPSLGLTHALMVYALVIVVHLYSLSSLLILYEAPVPIQHHRLAGFIETSYGQ